MELLSPSLKNKKNPPPKKFLVFWEMELSGSNIIFFVIFSQKKAFLIFRETETLKTFLIFQGRELSHISGNFLYFRK